MNKLKNGSRNIINPRIFAGFLISITLTLLLTSAASARRADSDSWSNPACTEPSSTLSGNSYEEYIMEIRGTSSYEYIPADCPSCNAPAEPAPRNDDDDEEEEHHSSAPAAPVPTACVPHYHAPTLSMDGYTPPYPLVLGQDPDEIGVDVTIMAQGGGKTNSCPGDPRGTITAFQLNEVTLSPEAIARIKGELQKAYPGARVLGSYPLHPSPSTSLGWNAVLRFHFDPQDPGAYNIVVTVSQHDGQTVSQTFQVPAHLLEATIAW